MARKIRVGIVFGGRSAEHEVSLMSAKNILEAIDKAVYEPVLIGIDRQGRWLLPSESNYILNAHDTSAIALNIEQSKTISMHPLTDTIFSAEGRSVPHIDVVFPILHGPFGEDGTIQGMLKLFDVPFVGCGVLGSAVGMDKDVMKRLLRDAGIPVSRFRAFRINDTIDYEELVSELGQTLFVKPANMGSSIGVQKVQTKTEFDAAVAGAFAYDTKILIEELVEGREVECAVLGNEAPIASGVGEVIPSHEFYTYEAKYIDDNGASLEVPANILPEETDRVRGIALRTFKVLCAEGLGRIDCFLKPDGNVLVNEINTMPGFTKISMYPRLWAASGIPYPELIDRLIKLGIERFERERSLRTSQT